MVVAARDAFAPDDGFDVGVIGTRGFPDVQGGVERHCEELYARVAAGRRVIVFTRAPYNTGRPVRSEHRGVALYKVWAPRNKYFEAIAHSVLALVAARRLRVRLVHVHAVGPGLVVPIARMMGFRVVFTHHGADYQRQKWGLVAKTALRIGEWTAVRWANAVVVISRGLEQSLSARFRRAVVFAPNGVDVPATRDSQDEPEAFALSVARLVPEKGLHVLLDALAMTSVRRVMIAGAADHVSSYARELQARSSDRATFLGARAHAEVLRLLGSARVFVLPSFHEGLPIALLEALAAGTIVVASDIAPHREIIRHGENGFLFATGDATDLARVLEQAWTATPEDRQRISTAARSTISSDYSWQTTSAKINAMYAALLT